MAVPKKNKTKSQPPATIQNFPIVGVGASAGGLDAFKRLLTAIPKDSGMAYVLVQHLDPSHESILPEILQRVTKLPVHEITDDIHLAPDHVYIIPSNKILTSTDGVLQLAPREKKILNFSIDIFFTSIADVHKEFAVGIVLSGTGSDGTLGLKAIKEQGGIGIAQDPESATYDSMPQSAVNAGVVDFILAPEKIPAQLLLINSTYKMNHFFKEEEELPKDDETIFKQILMLLRQRSGVDFTYYKQPTFHRRIARRITIVKKKNLSDYLKFLRSDKSEQDALFHDVLIPVTSFFRDPKTFQTLCETVFPSILKNKDSDEPIRIWIAGCSTGEEAFSIAICLHEFLGDKLSNTKIQLFASDISERAIKKARAAIYSKADVEKLSEVQVKNYFVKNNGSYEINKVIRDICVFAPHNFLKDPPFAKMDLISCRNVLIYMDTFLQKKAFNAFHYALRESGFLVLGKSETTGASSDLFNQISKHDKIYSRKPVPGRFMHVATDRKEESFTTKYKSADREEAMQTDYRKSAEQIMLLKSPASVVVNEAMDIVHIHGDITPFLAAPQGKPTHNLIKMAREGLAFELRNAIHKAAKELDTITKENIPLKTNEKSFLVRFEIIPLTDTVEPHYLIRFEKKIAAMPDENKSTSVNTNATQKQNLQLEKELSQTREDMRSVTEDMEAANEELQSANEELQSSNEEMQSLNEELETSKEELQSTNEELTIVNQELLDKQEQLNASRYYSESIITTLREPFIILDKSLRIKTANASFYKKFNAEEPETEGKLIYEIQNGQFDDYEMRKMLENILPQHERLVDYEIISKFPALGERHLLLNALKIKNDKTSEQLILLAIEDITERKTTEQKLETTHIVLEQKTKIIEASEKRFRTLAESIPNMIWAAAPDGQKNFFNKYFLDYTGLSFEELQDNGVSKIIFPGDLKKDLKLWNHALKTGEDFNMEKRIRRHDGTYRWHLSHSSAQKDTDGNIIGWIGSNTEIEQQKKFSEELEIKVIERTEELQNTNKELKQTNLQLDQFAYVASHDLQEPLRKIITFSMLLQDKHKEELSKNVKLYLKKIEGASSRMSTLIRDLLNYSRLLQPEKTFITTDLNETLKNILADFDLLISEKKAVIKTDMLPSIEAIPLQMNQLFYNLFSNALKYSKEDVLPFITITSSKLSEKKIEKYPNLNPVKAYIEIIFKDNGIGFKQQYAEKIFTIFQRLHNKDTYMGTGIGLALCKTIIENHHGEIFANAKENEGASFHVIIPMTQ